MVVDSIYPEPTAVLSADLNYTQSLWSSMSVKTKVAEISLDLSCVTFRTPRDLLGTLWGGRDRDKDREEKERER